VERPSNAVDALQTAHPPTPARPAGAANLADKAPKPGIPVMKFRISTP